MCLIMSSVILFEVKANIYISISLSYIHVIIVNLIDLEKSSELFIKTTFEDALNFLQLLIKDVNTEPSHQVLFLQYF